MSEADRLWDNLDLVFSRWGITEIPFTESAPTTLRKVDQIREVFTGRVLELETALTAFRGRERRRVLVYGWYGIGKTAFIIELLGILRRKAKDTLTVYISLPREAQDLATFALVALAREMEDDEWAQHVLQQMGLRPRRRPVEKRTEVDAKLVKTSEETVPVSPPQFPTLSFEDLLERAFEKYRRVVIAIDDLDKQDPSRVREMLRGAQGMLKGEASFILTSHPAGLTHDVLTRDLGLVDTAIKLDALDMDTTYRMLVNYLNSARPDHGKREPDDSQAVVPFTPQTAHELCQRSEGVPRYLNRLGRYVLTQAALQRAERITPNVLRQGLEYADSQLRSQSLTPEDYYVLELVLGKGSVSDETVTLEDLERLKVREFNEIMPILEKLVQIDLLRRLPTEGVAEFGLSPLLLDKGE
jgi:hypothetical protein